jgi:hypothetical protein
MPVSSFLTECCYVLLSLVPDSLVPGNPYILWISIALNSKYMDTFESQNYIIGETSV